MLRLCAACRHRTAPATSFLVRCALALVSALLNARVAQVSVMATSACSTRSSTGARCPQSLAIRVKHCRPVRSADKADPMDDTNLRPVADWHPRIENVVYYVTIACNILRLLTIATTGHGLDLPRLPPRHRQAAEQVPRQPHRRDRDPGSNPTFAELLARSHCIKLNCRM